MQLKIDPEIRDSIRPQTDAEFKQLEENILCDGEVREPLVVWNGFIVDGHHRWKIIQKHPELHYTVREKEFADKYDAIIWMCKKQLGQRNCTEEEKSYLRGKQYEAEKKAQGAPEGNQNRKNQSGQNVQFEMSRQEQQAGTAGRIGKQYGVDGKTIRRDADFAKGLDAADKVSPGLKVDVLSGKVKAPKSTISAIAKLDEPEQKKAAQALQSGEPVRIENGKIKFNKAAIDKLLAENGSDCPYNTDDLKMELDSVVTTFERSFKSTLTVHSSLLSEQNAKEKAKAALSEAEAAINRIRRLIS